MLHEYKLETASVLKARYQAMLTERRRNHESMWSEVGRYVAPRKYRDNFQTNPAPDQNTTNTPQMYDTTAVDSATTLAAGHSSAITPANARWFNWATPDLFDAPMSAIEQASEWYNGASQAAYKLIGASNFYSAVTEVYDDRSAFGVSCLAINESKNRVLSFRAVPVGTFTCLENEEGDVTTVFVTRQYRIDEVAELFGEDAVANNEVLSKAYEAYASKGACSYHEIVHAVFPRPDYVIDRTKLDSLNLPFASIWFLPNGKDEDGEAILKRSGSHEQCYMVSRYLTKPGASPYGYSPYEDVRSSILDAQKLRRIVQILAQRLALPPLLVPEQLTGQVDTNPGGRTVVPSNGAVPKEWMTPADPTWLLKLLELNQEQIRKAYNTDMFRMFSERTKQMTVREVSELASEKLMPFGPSFSRFTSDFRIAMERIWGICLRAGVFGPQEKFPKVIMQPVSDLLVDIRTPKTIYQSRMALAYRNQEIGAVDRMLERVGAVAAFDTSVVDNVNLDFCIRDSARGDGVPEDALIPYDKVVSDRKKQAEAAQQQALLQAQMAMQAQPVAPTQPQR